MPKKAKQQMCLNPIKPITKNQDAAFEDWTNGFNLVMDGYPGTGKSYAGVYLALNDIMNYGYFSKLVIIRSTVPVREMGFLPGTEQEKMASYEAPYEEIVNDLYERSDAYKNLKSQGKIEFSTTAFLRSVTISEAVILVDESQNMSMEELHTIITRCGENTRIIFCGDIGQDDLTSERFNETSGYNKFLDVLDQMESFSTIQFDEEDIVRSGLVKEYIIARYGSK